MVWDCRGGEALRRRKVDELFDRRRAGKSGGVCHRGLKNKIRAYGLQDSEGLDTVEANERLGFPADMRDYGVGAQILTDLGVHKMRMITNNPGKRAAIEGYGLTIVERVPLEIVPNEKNLEYLRTKKEKLGHVLHLMS